jgi:hypothetical protein
MEGSEHGLDKVINPAVGWRKSGEPASEPKFEPRTSQRRSERANHVNHAVGISTYVLFISMRVLASLAVGLRSVQRCFGARNRTACNL